jgi:hypothetical protein
MVQVETSTYLINKALYDEHMGTRSTRMVSVMSLLLYLWGKRPQYPLDKKLGPRASIDTME